MSNNGKLGEDYAAELLKQDGYEILQQNFRTRLGEIDIIATKDDIIAFVEVKTRGENSFGTPAQAVTISKQKKLVKAAEMFLLTSNTMLQPRFDVFEVYTTGKNTFKVIKSQHIKNAFGV